jgi:uncharacterized protein
VDELGTLLAYRFNHALACRQLNLIFDSSLVRIVYADAACETSALQWWTRFADKKFSFTDCVSFEFIKRLGIKEALSFDRDFYLAGYQTLP